MKTKNKTSKRNTVGSKQQKKKIIVTTVAVGAAGILGYFGWQYLKRKKESKKAGDINAVMKNMNTTYDTPLVTSAPKSKVTAKTQAATPNTSTGSSSFPLQKGSKGNNV